jgi:hypothetical protein
MSARRRVPALIALAALAWPARAGADEDSAAIADRYLAAMRRKGYAFLAEAELKRRRDEVATFVTKHLRAPLDGRTRGALLDGVDRCLDRLYHIPAGVVYYGAVSGTGGEEWVYLNDPDCFRTFQYHLWAGLTHTPLSPADVERRDAQRKWFREYLTYGPWRERNPQRNERIRARVLAELDGSFEDPLDLLSGPMSDDAAAELRRQFRNGSRGIDGDLNLMRFEALSSRFPPEEDPAGRGRRVYQGKLPFDDTVVGLLVNGPQLCFASNADFRGNHGSLSPSTVYDVFRCIEMWTEPAPAPMSPEMDAWLANEGRGELTLAGSTLVAVRGARIAELPVRTWFDADKLPEERLRAAIRDGGRGRIPIERLPRVNGPHRGDRTEGEFFVVVESREGRLAVVCLNNFESSQLMFWCRPRAAGP